MHISRSLSAKITLVIAVVSLAVMSAMVFFEQHGVKKMVCDQIRHAAEAEVGLAYMGIEKPMMVGDNKATSAEFATVAEKFKDLTVYLTSYVGNVTYSTDRDALRKDFQAVSGNAELSGLHRRGLTEKIQESMFLDKGDKKLLARVISIPNQARCHHCHGDSEPILGQMVMLTDVSEQWNAMNAELANSVGIGLAGLVLLIGVAVMVINRMFIGKVKRLAVDAQNIAAGDFTVSFETMGIDEIGTLSSSLRGMLESIKRMMAEAEANNRELAGKSAAVEKALAEAEQARRNALSAARDGKLQAACHLEGVVEVVSSASEQLSAQIEQSSRGSDEQTQRVGETATSMEQMNATIIEVAKNAGQAAETADSARHKAQTGSQVVTQVVREIAEVQSQALAMKADMTILGTQAEGIGHILDVISDIADQTNLLALNAAIEAARAGEAGRGFAVVADEVRKLAEKTMTATKQVGEAIREIQAGTRKNIDNVEQTVLKIEAATNLANDSGAALEQIVALVDRTTDQVRSIATASEQQSATSEEINRNIEDVNRISAETATAMRQSADAVGALALQAQDLKNMIDQMKQD